MVLSKNKIKIAVVDDHHLFRQGLISLLKEDKDLSVTIEASNGEELLNALKEKKAEVILLDIEMPIMDGIETTKRLRKKYPEVKIIILTMHDEEGIIVHMVEQGANGFLLKGTDIENLTDAIYAVMDNGYYFNDHVSQAMLKGLIGDKKIVPQFNKVTFNQREREIIKLVCQELTNKEIAKKLGLSIRTIDHYRLSILEKIGAKNTVGLVMYAIKNKML